MPNSINIYCDESCHLENDNAPFMVLGAIQCPLEKITEINTRIKEIKTKNQIPRFQEFKWTKISPSKEKFYTEILDYFFDNDDLYFRAIICDKGNLDHKTYNNSSHDDWYYKMYFFLLRKMISDKNNYNVYLDIKDTRSAKRRDMLHKTLCNSNYDYSREFLKKIQHARSHEVQLIQLADLLIGAVSYINRGLNQSETKLRLISRIQERAKLKTLTKSNYSEKFNLFLWQGRGGE